MKDKRLESIFDKLWAQYVDCNKDTGDTEDSLRDFLSKIDQVCPVYDRNKTMPDEYFKLQFLKAICILSFNYENGANDELMNIGKEAASNAAQGYGGYDEFAIVKGIYCIFAINVDDHKALGQCNKAYREIYKFDSPRGSFNECLVTKDYLRILIDDVYVGKKIEIADYFETKEDYPQLVKLYNEFQKFDSLSAKIQGLGRLSQIYRTDGLRGVKVDFDKAFTYAAACVNAFSPEEYDKDNFYHRLWMDSLGFCSLMSSLEESSYGTALHLAQKGYDLGDGYCAYLIGTYHRDGIGVPVDEKMAKKWFKNAWLLGYVHNTNAEDDSVEVYENYEELDVKVDEMNDESAAKYTQYPTFRNVKKEVKIQDLSDEELATW